ncbi:Secretory antigen SsaA-like protein transposon-related protein [Anopheles sinensis]|uniref:Secretory antigen SsaA-like protein transposon-related protein n=1 Tax=Anopheles sinensis TaxID=74873 RepID=A0A084WLV7_ANOSI|nr:Secretory antigen SsaA-like protein transposon-related protein [Anopheles sinensis]
MVLNAPVDRSLSWAIENRSTVAVNGGAMRKWYIAMYYYDAGGGEVEQRTDRLPPVGTQMELKTIKN